MIYLFIFIYLLYLSIHYDILENKKYRWTHFRIAITLLILVAGLRWRVGSDTVLYAQEFAQCHDLFHLSWSDFESVGRMPLWVLLNATCKTIWDDFLLFQFVVAAFSIGVTGYFIKKVCPSLCFYVLLCYFFGVRYALMHMELLRESVAVAFYLLGILALDNKRMKLALLYALLAVMSHVFSLIGILIFLVCHYLLPRNHSFRLVICFIFLLLTLFNNDFVISLIESSIGLYAINEEVTLVVLGYASSDLHGNIDKSIVSYVWLVMQFSAYIFMFHQCKKIYPQFIFLKCGLFDSAIFISIVFLCLKFSFVIFHRIGENYNYIFMCSLAVLFTKGVLLNRINRQQKPFVFIVLLLIPLLLGVKQLVFKEPVYGNLLYSRYYPYSSVFNKFIDSKRERHHQLRGGGYSEESDY